MRHVNEQDMQDVGALSRVQADDMNDDKGDVVVLHDASTMQALANPSRMRILATLRVRGEMSVGNICKSLNLASGSVSYHLRLLESAGLVRKVQHPEDGRTSWWEAVGQAMSPPQADQEDAAAVGEYLEAVSNTYREVYGRYLAVRDTEPAQWREASMNEDCTVCLTVEELTAMNAELDAVMQRWRHIAQGRSDSNGRRHVALIMQTFPWLP